VRRVRKFYQSSTILSGKTAYNDSLVNVSAAVLLRQMYFKELGVEVLRPSVRVKEVLGPARVALLKCLRNGVRKMSRERFLSTYTGMKLSRYRQALDSLGTQQVQASDAFVRAFLKYEKVEGGSVPRVISPRSFRYLAAAGRYLKAYEGPLYSCLRRLFGEVVVMKGMNSVDQARLLRRKWTRRSNPVAIGIDASRFDQHVSKSMLQFEHSIWLAMALPEDRARLSQLLSWQLTNRVSFVSEGSKYSYTLDGQRMSGDMNTGSGNCMLMCLMIYSYMASLGLTTSDYSIVDNGDDAVIICEGEDEARVRGGLKSYFSQLGFVMKVEDTVDVFEEVEFCQTHPVFDGRRWTMQRSFWAALEKDSMNMHTVQSLRELKVWMFGVGKAGLALASGMPITQEFYLMYQRVGIDKSTKQPLWLAGLEWLSRGMTAVRAEVTDAARVSFWRAFGVEPAIQREIEEQLRQVGKTVWCKDGRPTDPLFPHGSLVS